MLTRKELKERTAQANDAIAIERERAEIAERHAANGGVCEHCKKELLLADAILLTLNNGRRLMIHAREILDSSIAANPMFPRPRIRR